MNNSVANKGRGEVEEAVNHRDSQILSWFKLPIKPTEPMKIGPIFCDSCGGTLWFVRGRHPNEPKRIVCPTCAIEILESIVSNLYPNNQAKTETRSTTNEIKPPEATGAPAPSKGVK